MWGTCGRPQLPHTNTYRGAIVGAHKCPTFQNLLWGNCGRPQLPHIPTPTVGQLWAVWGTCGRPQLPHFSFWLIVSTILKLFKKFQQH